MWFKRPKQPSKYRHILTERDLIAICTPSCELENGQVKLHQKLLRSILVGNSYKKSISHGFRSVKWPQMDGPKRSFQLPLCKCLYATVKTSVCKVQLLQLRLKCGWTSYRKSAMSNRLMTYITFDLRRHQMPKIAIPPSCAPWKTTVTSKRQKVNWPLLEFLGRIDWCHFWAAIGLSHGGQFRLYFNKALNKI